MASSSKLTSQVIVVLFLVVAALILSSEGAAADQAPNPAGQTSGSAIQPLFPGRWEPCAPANHEGTTANATANSCIDVLFVADDGDYKLDNLGRVVNKEQGTPHELFADDLKALVSATFEPDGCPPPQNTPDDCGKLWKLRNDFRFWYTSERGSIKTKWNLFPPTNNVYRLIPPTGCEQNGEQDPGAQNATCLSMDVIAIIHARSLNDASVGRMMTSEWNKPKTFLHELAHAATGLADEYADGGYFMPPYDRSVPFNLFDTVAKCREFAREFANEAGWNNSENECDYVNIRVTGGFNYFRFNHSAANPPRQNSPLMFSVEGTKMVPFDDLFFRASGKRLKYVEAQCGQGRCGQVQINSGVTSGENGLTPARSLIISVDLKLQTGQTGIETDPCAAPTPDGLWPRLQVLVAPQPFVEAPPVSYLISPSLQITVVEAPPSSLVLNDFGPIQLDISYLPTATAPTTRLGKLFFFNPGIVHVECDESGSVDPDGLQQPLQGGFYFLPEASLSMVLPFYGDIADFNILPGIGIPDLAPIIYPPDLITLKPGQVNQVFVDHFAGILQDIVQDPQNEANQALLADDDLRVLVQRQDLHPLFVEKGINLAPWADVGMLGKLPVSIDVGGGTLDEAQAAGTYLITSQVLQTLVAEDGQRQTRPELANVTSTDMNGLQWSVRLVPTDVDVRFHDGTLLDNAAVAANFERWKNAGLLDISSIDPGSNGELIITLGQPQPDLASLLTSPQFGIHSPKALEQPEYGKSEIGVVGTGPYRYLRGAPDALTAQVMLERNREYQGIMPPETDYLTISFLPPGSDLVDAVSSNQVDLLAVPESAAATLTAEAIDSNLSFQEQTVFSTVYMGKYLNRGPFANPLVRKAFNLAVDRNCLASSLPADVIATDTILPGDQPTANGFDPAKARALLEQAGYDEGFLLNLFYTKSDIDRYPELLDALKCLKQDLKGFGIDVQDYLLPPDNLEAARSSDSLRDILPPSGATWIDSTGLSPAWLRSLPAADSPNPAKDTAIGYVDILDDSTPQPTNLKQLLDPPGIADAISIPRLLAPGILDNQPLTPGVATNRAEQEYSFLPLLMEKHSVAWLANKSVTDVKVVGQEGVLSLANLKVVR